MENQEEQNVDSKPSWWFAQLDDRQQREVLFAQTYARQFGHGTDGHHRLLLIAKLAQMLDEPPVTESIEDIQVEE